MIQKWLGIALLTAIIFPTVSLAEDQAVVINDDRHLKVFYKKNRFAGWPANNGIWQWDNEILVGFSLGYLAPPEKRGLHQIDPARPRSNMLARSLDGGLNFQWLASPVKENGLHSGNPPSMVRLADGRLCITYANRNEPHTIRAVFSSDDGRTWGPEYVLRRNAGEPDIGYTRTVQRPDGKLVTIYYWLDKPRSERYIAATIWSAPKIDE